MEWISSTALTLLGWMNTIATRPEAILLTSIMLFLVLALSTGLVFALDPEEPRAIRIIGVLILVCCIGALSCTAFGLAIS